MIMKQPAQQLSPITVKTLLRLGTREPTASAPLENPSATRAATDSRGSACACGRCRDGTPPGGPSSPFQRQVPDGARRDFGPCVGPQLLAGVVSYVGSINAPPWVTLAALTADRIEIS